MHPTHILVHPRVHRAHQLKSAGLVYSNLQRLQYKYNTSEKYSRNAMSMCL